MTNRMAQPETYAEDNFGYSAHECCLGMAKPQSRCLCILLVSHETIEIPKSVVLSPSSTLGHGHYGCVALFPKGASRSSVCACVCGGGGSNLKQFSTSGIAQQHAMERM
jgi:hypothetical protein